jgi:hypothetical protein
VTFKHHAPYEQGKRVVRNPQVSFTTYRTICLTCGMDLEAVDAKDNGGTWAWFEVGTCKSMCPGRAVIVPPVTRGRGRSAAAQRVFG